IQNISTANVQAGGVKVNSNGFDVTIPQVFSHDGALGGTPDGGFTKSGSGTVTLTGANTYTGPTSADAGKLVLGASLTTSSSVSVSGTGAIELSTDGSQNKVIKTGPVS